MSTVEPLRDVVGEFAEPLLQQRGQHGAECLGASFVASFGASLAKGLFPHGLGEFFCSGHECPLGWVARAIDEQVHEGVGIGVGVLESVAHDGGESVDAARSGDGVADDVAPGSQRGEDIVRVAGVVSRWTSAMKRG